MAKCIKSKISLTFKAKLVKRTGKPSQHRVVRSHHQIWVCFRHAWYPYNLYCLFSLLAIVVCCTAYTFNIMRRVKT